MRTLSWRAPLSRLVYAGDLLRELVARDIKLRYKRSFLGILWSLVNPLAQLAVLNFLFGMVLPLGIQDYPLFLFSGLLVWNWFNSSLVSATASIVDNRSLIRLPNFSVTVLPAVSVLSNLIHFLLALPILLLFVQLEGHPLNAAILALPLVIALQFIFTLSLAYIVSAWQVTFRDVQHLLGVILMLLFYLSPVFYDPSAVPAPYQTVYNLNPMVPLLTAYRTIVIGDRLPGASSLLMLAGVFGLLLAVSLMIFVRASRRFVEEL